MVDFDINLSQPSDSVVTVDYATVIDDFSSPATPGIDFAPVTGTAEFQPGDTTFTFSVEVFGDTFVEINEEFGVELSNAVLGNITTGDASVLISDNDEFEFGVTVDFGPIDSPVQSDAIGFTDESYSPALGMGWSAQNGFNLLQQPRGNELTRDGAIMNDGIFEVDVPNGDYLVTTHFGSINRVDPFDIILEGVTNTFTPGGTGPNISASFLTTVIDGRITMGLDGGGGLSDNVRISGFSVEEAGGRGLAGGGSDFSNNPSIWNPASSDTLSSLNGTSLNGASFNGGEIGNGRSSILGLSSSSGLSGSTTFDRSATEVRWTANETNSDAETDRVDWLNELADEWLN